MCDGKDKADIIGMNEGELEEFITAGGYPKYRAKQIYGWLHNKCVASFDDMKNIPKELRDALRAKCYLAAPKIVRQQISKLDGTNKFLFGFEDESFIEAVLMRQSYGNSVCISSQVGCAMGCVFCASTVDGCKRNLFAGEMLSQVYAIENILRDSGERISHIVVMGTGEPFLNYDNLIKFIEIVSSRGGLNISKRNITVSTCGIVPKIYDFADEGFPVTLAISLHAPKQEKREKLMPVARQYSIEDIKKAGRYYFDKTKRRLTIEYAMIDKVNDTDDDAVELANAARAMCAHVNLIVLNEVEESPLKPSNMNKIRDFQSKLAKLQINVTIRKSMGADIDGACGQLRMKEQKGKIA